MMVGRVVCVGVGGEWDPGVGVGRGELASTHARHIHVTIELPAVSLVFVFFVFVFLSRTLLNCLANSLVARAVWDTYAGGFSTVK